VLAIFGSIAGAESVLMALDENLHPRVAMAEAPHGTAPTLQGKNVANPMAMLLAQQRCSTRPRSIWTTRISRWRAIDYVRPLSKAPPTGYGPSTSW